MRFVNGKLVDYDFQTLMDNVKERGESLYTTLEHNGVLYDFTIRAMEFFTKIDENTKWQFDVHRFEEDKDTELITKYGECSNLLEKDLVKKMSDFRDKIINGEID